MAKKSAAPKRATKKRSAVSSKSPSPKRASRKKPEKYTYLEGMEPIKIPEIETAAEEYELAKEERIEASEREVAAKKKLKAAMELHAESLKKNADGWPVYHAQDIQRVVTLEAVEMTVKVKKEKAAPASEEE